MPNGVGDSLRVEKVGDRAEISWTSSVVDPTHDGAAYYQVFVSTAAEAGFAVGDTTTTLTSSRDLFGSTEFYKITAFNPAGTSGDEPAP